MFTGGETVERMESPWVHAANNPEHKHAMHMLFLSCYSNFTPNSITLDPRFMKFFHEGTGMFVSFPLIGAVMI